MYWRTLSLESLRVCLSWQGGKGKNQLCLLRGVGLLPTLLWMFGDKRWSLWESVGIEHLWELCAWHCPRGAVKNELEGGKGDVWALFLVVFRELCEVNMTFIKWRQFSWTIMWGKVLCRLFWKKKNEKSLYFVKVRSVLRGISVKLLFKCVFGGLYGGFVMGAAKE